MKHYLQGTDEEARLIESWLAVPGNAIEVFLEDGDVVAMVERPDDLVTVFRQNLEKSPPPVLGIRFGVLA